MTDLAGSRSDLTIPTTPEWGGTVRSARSSLQSRYTPSAHGDLHDVPGAPSGGRARCFYSVNYPGADGDGGRFSINPNFDRCHTVASRSLRIPSREPSLGPR